LFSQPSKESSATFLFYPVSADRSRILAKIGQQHFLFVRFLLTVLAPAKIGQQLFPFLLFLLTVLALRQRLVSNFSFFAWFC